METVAPHRPSFCPHPLALLAACFAAGVLLARALQVPLSALVMIAAAAYALAAFAFSRRRRGLATALACAGFALAGASLASVERGAVARDRVRRFYDEGRIEGGEPVELTGVVARAPEVAPDGFFVELKVERARARGEEEGASGAVELFAPVRDPETFARYDGLELRRGARLRVMTALERAGEFRNPGANSRTEFLERQGFDAVGVIKSPLLVERLGDERVALPLVWLESWRARLHERLGETFSLEAAGVLQAAMLGNRYGLSRGAAERFRDGGTFHVLVISGLHISFLGGLALWLARKLTGRRALQFAAAVAPLWAYAVAVGAGASVVRAALMFSLVALAPVLHRRADSLNALGGAALALLVRRPSDLFDPSFQLTFLSVLGIVAPGWTLLTRLKEVGAWRPTHSTPYPPRCPRWFRALGETLFWSERAWARESARGVHSCNLFKTRAAARLERWHVQRPLRYAFAAAAVSASVQVVLLPLLVAYFHRLSLASLALNVFVGALMALASLGSLAAVAVASVSHALAAPLVWSVERAVWLMSHSVEPFSRARVASLRVPEYEGWRACVYAFYYLPLAALVLALARWRPLELADAEDDSYRVRVRRRARVRRAAWVALAASAFVVVAHPLSAPHADGRLRVDFLDVGQGDAALLTMPDGATLLIDGGGRPNFGARGGAAGGADSETVRFERDARGVGDAVVSEFLWSRGLDRVDYLLATHAHADHIGGLKDVARNFRPRAALVARTPAAVEYAEFAAAMRASSVPVRLVARGDALRFGAATVEVLYPPPASSSSTDGGEEDAGALPSGNDDSVVLRVRYGARCFLLTGDIERGAEASLVAAGDDLRCDVLKVAHHGSATSSTAAFVAATRPAFAVVSVGLASPFGHPNAAVVGRWRASGAQVLQTGRRGTISFTTDGRDLAVETFVRD
ncbi:MAG TPA: ComEC/Rec2 family competence protein [Pyrinomonadaceae bacterium]|jgi:competence protein ComEC|nr:ComEC/Rec2 family competence protein [Pyrinomonadaceae bacterium]